MVESETRVEQRLASTLEDGQGWMYGRNSAE